MAILLTVIPYHTLSIVLYVKLIYTGIRVYKILGQYRLAHLHETILRDYPTLKQRIDAVNTLKQSQIETLTHLFEIKNYYKFFDTASRYVGNNQNLDKYPIYNERLNHTDTFDTVYRTFWILNNTPVKTPFPLFPVYKHILSNVGGAESGFGLVHTTLVISLLLIPSSTMGSVDVIDLIKQYHTWVYEVYSHIHDFHGAVVNPVDVVQEVRPFLAITDIDPELVKIPDPGSLPDPDASWWGKVLGVLKSPWFQAGVVIVAGGVGYYLYNN